MTAEQRAKQEMFAQNLKNMGIAKRDMTATKKVITQLAEHYCQLFHNECQYCPLSGCSDDGECAYCMAGIFEWLIEYLETHLEK